MANKNETWLEFDVDENEYYDKEIRKQNQKKIQFLKAEIGRRRDSMGLIKSKLSREERSLKILGKNKLTLQQMLENDLKRVQAKNESLVKRMKNGLKNLEKDINEFQGQIRRLTRSPYVCPVCQKMCKSQAGLTQHARTHKPKPPVKDKEKSKEE